MSKFVVLANSMSFEDSEDGYGSVLCTVATLDEAKQAIVDDIADSGTYAAYRFVKKNKGFTVPVLSCKATHDDEESLRNALTYYLVVAEDAMGSDEIVELMATFSEEEEE